MFHKYQADPRNYRNRINLNSYKYYQKLYPDFIPLNYIDLAFNSLYVDHIDIIINQYSSFNSISEHIEIIKNSIKNIQDCLYPTGYSSVSCKKLFENSLKYRTQYFYKKDNLSTYNIFGQTCFLKGNRREDDISIIYRVGIPYKYLDYYIYSMLLRKPVNPLIFKTYVRKGFFDKKGEHNVIKVNFNKYIKPILGDSEIIELEDIDNFMFLIPKIPSFRTLQDKDRYIDSLIEELQVDNNIQQSTGLQLIF